MTKVELNGYIKDDKVYRNAFLHFDEREIGAVVDTEEKALEYFVQRFSAVEEKVNGLELKINEAVNKGSFLGQLLHLKKNLSESDALGDFESLYKKLEILEEQLQGTISNNREKNLEIKRALLTELKVLAVSKEWKSASHLVKELQSKWAKTGAVASEYKEEVEDTYQVLIQGFYDNRAAFYNDLDKMMKERSALYLDFLKNAEGLREIKDLEKLRTQIRVLREEWKGLGRIQKAENDQHWASFQTIIKESLEVAKKAQKKSSRTDQTQNLKNRKAFLKKLSGITEALGTPFNLDKLKGEWTSMGPVSKKDIDALRPEYSRLMMILSESKFVEDLARKKAKKGSKPEEIKKLKVRLLRDLLERDKRELNTFNENLGNFSTAKGLDKIIGNKLELQERKVEVKKLILDQLRKQQ